MLKHAGKYEIVSELGRGGFGRVYRALDPVLGMVAIKTLAVENDPAVLTRFRNEAAAARRLSHPNIVTIYDFGEQDGVPFIVMQLLEGQDLDKVIQKRVQLPLWQKIRMMTQTASGLFHAHVNGVIHRDVKPANIMLLPEGDIKIMDFGIALASQDTHNRVTPRGTVIGTLRYMAPEQFQGAEQDARSDIFSFGLVFYELLSGIHPFFANEPATLMYNVLNRDPVPIREVCPECPEMLQPVIARLLQKDPDFRYQSLEDVIFDCEPALEQLQRASAQDLFEEAKRVRAEGRLDASLGLLRQAMELDAACPGLREFREDLQAELRRLSVRPRLDALAQEASQQLAAGNATEAVLKLEAAARLDPTDTGIQAQLGQARATAEKARRAARLLADAERALKDGNFSGAQRMAQQAADISPTSSRALELLQRAQKVQAEQEQRMRLSEGLGRARRLLGIQAWDQASEVLESLQHEFPENEDVRGLNEKLQASRQEEERQQRLTAGLTAARSLIRSGDLAGAQVRLGELRKEFPENVEIEQMLQAVDSEIESRQRREFVAAALRDARTHSQQNAFEEATAVLRIALDKYPGDLLLRNELCLVDTARREKEREADLRKALRAAQDLERQSKLDEALALLESFSAKYGADPAIEELQATILSKREEVRRLADLREMTKRVKELLAANNAEAAMQLLHDPPEALKDHPEVQHLRTLATVQLYKQNERRTALDKALSSADKQRQAGDFDAAQKALAAFTEAFGPDSKIVELDALIRSDRDSRRREDEITRVVMSATQLLASGEFDKVVQMLRGQPSGVRQAPPVAKILTDAEKKQQDLTERQQQLRAAESHLQAGHAADAARVLSELQARFPDDAEIASLLERATVMQQLNRVEEARKRGDLPAARSLIRKLAEQQPADASIRTLAAKIETEFKDWEARREAQRAIQEAEEMASRQNYAGAVERLETAAAQFPADPAIKAELERATKSRDLDRRHQEYVRGRQEYQAFLAKHQFEEAAGRIRQMLVRFPDNGQLQMDLQAASGAEQLKKQRLKMDSQIAPLEAMFRAGNAEGVRKEAQRLLAEGEEPRVRELLIWAEDALRKAQKIREARSQPKPWLWLAGGGVLAAILGGVYFSGNHGGGSAAPLRVNPGEVSFNYQQGGSAPGAKTVTVSGGASGVAWTAAPSNPWIDAKPGENGALSLSVRAQDLDPGDYTGVVTVSEIDAAPVNVQVRLQIRREAKPASQPKPPVEPGSGGESKPAPRTASKSGSNPSVKETPRALTPEEIQKQLEDALKGNK